jgi:hypothetical protein
MKRRYGESARSECNGGAQFSRRGAGERYGASHLDNADNEAALGPLEAKKAELVTWLIFGHCCRFT